MRVIKPRWNLQFNPWRFPDATRTFYYELLTQDSAKVAHLCSMKITQDVREYAARHHVSEEQAIQLGMAEKSQEFKDKGGQVYQKV